MIEKQKLKQNVRRADLSGLHSALVIHGFTRISYNKIIYCHFTAAHSLFSMNYPCIYIPHCALEELWRKICNTASKSTWYTNIGIILCNWTSFSGTTQFLYHCENRIWLWILWGNRILTSPQSVWTGCLPALGCTVFNLLFLLLRSDRSESLSWKQRFLFTYITGSRLSPKQVARFQLQDQNLDEIGTQENQIVSSYLNG